MKKIDKNGNKFSTTKKQQDFSFLSYFYWFYLSKILVSKQENFNNIFVVAIFSCIKYINFNLLPNVVFS